jgi:outer membrane protein TolC
MVRLCMNFGRAALLALLAASICGAQQPLGGGASGSSRAIQLPGATGQPGSVSTQQSPTAGTGPATINSSITIDGSLAGSVPAANTPAGPIKLTLVEAVKRGLAANLGPIAATNAARAARAERIESLSALLPNIAANASDTVTQVNLAAYGFQFKVPANLNFSIPSVVGPYNYSSLETTLSQSIYDPVARRNWKAREESEHASLLDAKDARELVVLAVGGSYLQTVATAARVASQHAQVENAQAIYRQAQVRKAAGTNARIDVTRSEVELQTEQQRLSSLEADLGKQTIGLARLIGLPLDRELVLVEPLTFNATTIPQASASIQQAFEHRADLQAYEARVKAAERALSAARAERLPSATINGDYGVIGPNPASTHGVFAVTGSLNVPIWQGGRTKGDIEQADATLDQRRAELADQRGRIEQQVRVALIELETASGQVRLAQNNRALAAETLTESRDRFNAGVSTTVEVVQAQQQVASAESDYISSLFSFNLAKLSLARATGEAESDLADLLPGASHP